MNRFVEFVIEKQNMIITATLQHIYISFLSVLLGTLLAVPLGIWLTRKQKMAKYVLAISGILQTIPSLVLFGLAMPIFGIGLKPALAVLFLYSILPILRNTYTGINEVDHMYVEAARGMGMSSFQILWMVEFPLALPVIIAGIRISTVYIISWATLSAMIGAGGLGDLIFLGMQSVNYNIILSGAIPASILAVAAGLLIGLLQKAVTPRGLKQ